MPTLVAKSRSNLNALIAAGKTSATLSDTDCPVHGLTGMDAIASFAGHAGVLVANGTVGIVESSRHSPPDINSTATIGGNTYTVVDVQSIDGTDICYAKLDRKVTGVSPITVIPSGSPAWGGTMEGLPAAWVVIRSDRIELMEMSNAETEGADTGKSVTVRQSNDPQWSVGTILVAGDSDSPLVTVIDGAVVFLATAYSVRTGSDISAYHLSAEALWLSAWGITDSYTEADLSAYDDYDTPLESVAFTITPSTESPEAGAPFTLAVTCEPGSLGTVYGRVFLRRRFNRVARRQRRHDYRHYRRRVLPRLRRSTFRLFRLQRNQQHRHACNFRESNAYTTARSGARNACQ